MIEKTVFNGSERVIVGCVYLGLSVVILPVHSVILGVFLKHKDYRQSETYRIMFSIGVADCLQLLSHGYAGLSTLTENNFNYTLEKFFGGLGNAAWLAMIPQTFVLALNRLFVFQRKRTNKVIFPILLGLCWLFGSSFFVAYMTKYTGILYDDENFYWSYDEAELSPLVSLIEYYTSVPILICAFIVYVVIVITIVIMRSSLTSNKQFLLRQEFKLLLQSFFIFLYAVVLICCWHFYMYFLPDSKWTSVVINVFWILFSSLNPFLYLIMNSTIRSRFLEMFGIRLPHHNGKLSVVTPSKQLSQGHNSRTRTTSFLQQT